MGLTYETQSQERDGKLGFVVTISRINHSWTTPWIEAPGATTHEEAQIQARAQVAALHKAMTGEERR